jgi:predicted RNA-binding protein with PIN domain
VTTGEAHDLVGVEDGRPGLDDRSEGDDDDRGTGAEVGPLPPAVRSRVVALAADGLGALPGDEVPAALKAFWRFTPARRAKLAATPIAAALETDPVFRQRVAERVREAQPDLARALDEGVLPSAADPLDVAAAAYLLRPSGWPGLVERATESLSEASSLAASARAFESVTRLQEQLAAVRAQGRSELERLRAELQAAKAEVSELRRKLGESREATRRARADAAEAEEALEQHRTAGATALATSEAELRRIKAKLAESDAALETARRTVREGRALEDARMRLLLDTVVEAAQGLRRELALPPTALRPADVVAGIEPAPAGVGDVTERGLAHDHPAVLDQLLALPQVHLIVDGYNVTKSGYGGLPLEAQRQRLVTGLAALAARCGAEVTCCFDGAAVEGVPSVAQPRGVRVRFSEPGVTADDLIRRLVQAEPPGRPVVVVTSDREVADGVRKAGARSVPSTALLKRLERA